MKTIVIGLAAALMMTAGGAIAAETKPAPDTANAQKVTTAPAAKPDAKKVMHSEKSLKCSAEADTKQLHGKARKEFRKTCMKTV